jgi:transcriptional regulator with XRE-family HTH domain
MPTKAKTDERPSRVHKDSPRYRREAKALGLRLRRVRDAEGWTLEQTAERCDMDLKHLQKIEAGTLNVTLVTLVRLSNGLRQPIAVFFGGQVREARRAQKAKG